MNYRKMFQEADAARQINRSIGEPLDNKLREYHKLLNEVLQLCRNKSGNRMHMRKKKEEKLNDIP